MRPTEAFRAHHDDLLTMIAEMRPKLDVATLRSDAKFVRADLSKLAGLLTVHLSMEDRTLYPKLQVHTNPDVAAIATRFMNEMGGLKEAFASYSKRWGAHEIEGAPVAFIGETTGVFAALIERIGRENDELYALLDEAA